MSSLWEWKPQLRPSEWASNYIITFIFHLHKFKVEVSEIHVKLHQTLQSCWMDKDIFVLPLRWMAQFSCCWCNSACGGWLVENSWETSGTWILHWGGFLGKMLCVCLCLQSTWPLLSPSSRLFPRVREESLLQLMLRCRRLFLKTCFVWSHTKQEAFYLRHSPVKLSYYSSSRNMKLWA